MNADAKTYLDGLPTYCSAALQTAYDKIRSGHYSDAGIYRGLCKDFDEVGEKHPDRKLFSVWFAAVEQGEAERPGRQLAEDGIPPKELAKSKLSNANPLGKGRAERQRNVKAPPLATGEDAATGMETALDDLGVSPPAGIAEPISARPMDAAFMGVQFAPVIDNAEMLLDQLSSPACSITWSAASDAASAGEPALVAVKAAAGRLLEEVIVQMTREIEQSARETAARMLREVADEIQHSAI